MNRELYSYYITKLKNRFVGKSVMYGGKMYKVVGVDYNGFLLIDKPNTHTKVYTSPTTAIHQYDCKII